MLMKNFFIKKVNKIGRPMELYYVFIDTKAILFYLLLIKVKCKCTD